MINYYGSLEDDNVFAQVKKIYHYIFVSNMFFSFMFTDALTRFNFIIA